MDGKHVLVVEDDPQVQALLTEWLTAAGYEVTAFSGFEEARLSLKTRAPDLLLTDIRLGPYNGLQLVIEAREVSTTMRIVVITGYEDAVLRRDAAHFGATFLTKPLTRADLLRVLKESADSPDPVG